jgi:adenylate cyclase
MEPGKPLEVKVKAKVRWRSWKYFAMAAAVVVIIGAVVAWQFIWRPFHPKIEMASKEKMAFPLPDKPSIAVLPFTNMSGDPKEEYFSDGITEEIITALSKVPYLFVIARNSTFTYKGKAVKVKQVSEELGVRYVLEGSVRQEGNKVRITAQLIDAITGHHLWAERYDRDLKDIFALQDEITMKIITALQVKLTQGEQAAMIAKGTKNLEAFIKCLQSLASLTTHTKEGNALGRKLAEESIALDPKYPRPYVALAQTYMLDVLLGTADSPESSLEKAAALLKRAIALDDSEAAAHGVLGYLYAMIGQYDKAIAEAERSVSLNPNDASNLTRMSFTLINTGRAEEAISVLKSVRRLNPTPPQAYFVQLSTAYRLTGQYKEAIEIAKEALKHVPNNQLAYLQLVTAYSMAGQEQEARAAAVEVMKINPKSSLEQYAKTLYFKNQADKERTIEALRKAGLK